MGDPSTAPAYLRTITQIANGVTLRSYTLTHSYLGQILQRTATGAGGMAETDTFGYDSRGRLTSENNQVLIGGVTSTKTGTYQYDLSNNLQGGVGGWTYNSNNLLTAAPPMGGLPGATGLTYDSAGNLTAANGMGFTYDALEEMTQATGTLQGTVTYTYDVLGRRASKTASGVTTNFLYDGDDIIAEATGAGVGAAISASYVWGPGGLISGALLAGGVWSTQFVLPDDADDDRCTVDEGANVVTQQSASAYYQPYQNVTVGTWTPPISRGAYKDGETGLAYAGGGSYYAPATGSFIAPDGVGSSSGLDGDPEEDWIGNCGSYGSFLAKAGRKGWNGLKAMPQWQPGSKDRRQISGMLSAIPILGQLKMGLEALTGHDGVGGTCLSTGSRIFNGAMAMLPVVGKVAGEAGGAVRGADAAEEAAASGGLMAVKGTALVRYYPPNNGFLGQPVEEVLERGTVLWRYGSEEGRFLARAGASPLDISLSPDKWNLIPRSYVVQTPFQVSGGIAAPWAPFGTPGGAWQGLSRLSIADLIKGGYLIAK